MADPKTYTQEEYDAMVAERDAVKANRDEVLKEKKKADLALKNWDGKDPAKYDQLVAAAEEADRKKAAAEGDFTKITQQMAEKHKGELAAEQKKTAKALAALEKRKVAKLTEELAKADALPDMMDLLVLKGSASVQLRESDDDWEEYVSDGKGNQLVADGSGTPMTMKQFVETTLKTQYPAAFKGSGSSGGGAPRSNAGGGGNTIPLNDGQAFLRELGPIIKGEKIVPVTQP